MTHIIVTGKTFDHRDTLKEMGGRWNDASKRWELEYATQKQIDRLKNIPGLMVTPASEDQPKPKPIRHEPREPLTIDAILETVGWGAGKPQDGKHDTIMRGDDPTYFNAFKDKNPIMFFGFSSLSKMTDHIENSPEDCRKEAGYRPERGGDWYGTRDMPHALDLAHNGWPEGVKRASEIADMLTADHAKQRRRKYSVAGGRVSVGRLLASNPAHMVARIKQDGSRAIRLFVQNNGSAGISGKSMLMRAAIICATVDILEANGYSCEIISVTTDYADSARKNPGCHTVVNVKAAGEKANIADIAFTLGHLSFFRRFIFANVERETALREMWNTQGYSTEAFNKHHMPERANDYYIRHLDTNIDNPHEMFQKIMPENFPIKMELET